MARQRAFQEAHSSVLYYGYQPALWDWGGFGWGGFGWNSLYFAGPFPCDPFSLMTLYVGPVCFSPASYGYGFDPFLFDFGLASYLSPGYAYGMPLSPFYFGPNCLSCTSLDLFPVGMPESFWLNPSMTPLGSPSISNGAVSGLVSKPASASWLAEPGGILSTYAYATPPATHTAVTLVLKDGTKIQATRYRLDADGSFHYATTSGTQETIPFNRLDVNATMKANGGKGVNFLVPKPATFDPRFK